MHAASLRVTILPSELNFFAHNFFGFELLQIKMVSFCGAWELSGRMGCIRRWEAFVGSVQSLKLNGNVLIMGLHCYFWKAKQFLHFTIASDESHIVYYKLTKNYYLFRLFHVLSTLRNVVSKSSHSATVVSAIVLPTRGGGPIIWFTPFLVSSC